MTDIDKRLRELAAAAVAEPPPKIDVRASVLETIARRTSSPPWDWTPLAFASGAVAVAASCLAVLWPAWRILLEPWTAYFL